MEVAPGIHRIEGDLGERYVCQYLLVGEERTLLVDTGLRDMPNTVIAPYLDGRAVEVRGDDGARHVAQAGVDQQRPLLAHEQVLADVALAEVTLDPVDAAGHLHAGMMPRWRGRR